MPQKIATRRSMRDTILDAADRLLAHYGYPKTTMDEIAREAGISKRTIYLNFANKEQVALSSIDRVVHGLIEQLTAIARTAQAPDARLRQMLMTRVLFRFDSVQAYHRSFDDLFAAIRPAYLARREVYFAAEAGILAGVLEEGERTGVFATADALGTAHTLLLATNALLPYSLSARELEAREEIERKARAVANLLLDGVRKRETRKMNKLRK